MLVTLRLVYNSTNMFLRSILFRSPPVVGMGLCSRLLTTLAGQEFQDRSNQVKPGQTVCGYIGLPRGHKTKIYSKAARMASCNELPKIHSVLFPYNPRLGSGRLHSCHRWRSSLSCQSQPIRRRPEQLYEDVGAPPPQFAIYCKCDVQMSELIAFRLGRLHFL